MEATEVVVADVKKMVAERVVVMEHKAVQSSAEIETIVEIAEVVTEIVLTGFVATAVFASVKGVVVTGVLVQVDIDAEKL